MSDQSILIKEALDKVEKLVLAANVSNDITYFQYHRKRFQVMGETILATVAPKSTVLDIGSHYLHSSLLLHFLGYDVVAMDVSAFSKLDIVAARAQENGITQITEDNLESLDQLATIDNHFDVIIFAEIFEHITFNPIPFWKKVHRIMKDHGIIYLSTPNAITVYAIIRTIYNVLSFKSIGISIHEIFQHVTYGHHWKEYSVHEIHQYFKSLNDGFTVHTKKFTYKTVPPTNSLSSWGRNLLFSLGNAIPYFKEAIEAVIRIDKSQPWKIDPPTY
jgi:2-polyprenyl-6-hydroxyphenyl methylase/3-demethylubiquinone-9 3-methyltransferase